MVLIDFRLRTTDEKEYKRLLDLLESQNLVTVEYDVRAEIIMVTLSVTFTQYTVSINAWGNDHDLSELAKQIFELMENMR